ncbi:hypothetical protein MD484_g7798, partial [Candolleomyces efflorescens]
MSRGPGWQAIKQLAFLESKLPEYHEAKAKKELEQWRNETNGQFFALWPTPEDEAKEEYRQPKRPRKDAPPPKPEFTNEQQDQWVKKRKSQIATWFNNKASEAKKEAPPLALAPVEYVSRAPKLLSEVQIYAKQASSEKKEGWNRRLMEEGVEKKNWLARYTELARASFEAECVEVKASVRREREEAKRQREEVLETERSMMQAKPANLYQNKERAAAVQGLPESIALFCNQLGARTGWCFTVLAGGPNPNDPEGAIETFSYDHGQAVHGSKFKSSYPASVTAALNDLHAFCHQVTPYEERIMRVVNPSPQVAEKQRTYRERLQGEPGSGGSGSAGGGGVAVSDGGLGAGGGGVAVSDGGVEAVADVAVGDGLDKTDDVAVLPTKEAVGAQSADTPPSADDAPPAVGAMDHPTTPLFPNVFGVSDQPAIPPDLFDLPDGAERSEGEGGDDEGGEDGTSRFPLDPEGPAEGERTLPAANCANEDCDPNIEAEEDGGEPEGQIGGKRRRGSEIDEVMGPEEVEGRRATRRRKNPPSQRPTWMQLALEHLKQGPECEEWRALVDAWITFEESLTAAALTKQRLPAAKERPGVLMKWVSAGKKYGSIPKLDEKERAALATQWLHWWKEMQPVTRKYSHEDDLPLPLLAKHDLGSLKRGGPSGLVLAVIALKWWYKADVQIWKRAVEDVRACFVKMRG